MLVLPMLFWLVVYANLTGDLNGEAANDPDATLELLPLGFCATRGIIVDFCCVSVSCRLL
jgi:hypothetical protein